METDRLVLLTSAADEADTSILRSSLKAWATAGMLGHVAWAHAEDLTPSLERAACEAVVGRNWVSGTFGSVTERGLSELWLVALRAPADPSEPARRTEDAACDEVLRQVGSSVKVRSITVTVPGHPCEYRRSDFSGAWEAHLLHDRRITASSRSATTDASAAAPLVLGAALALCVTAGWSGAEEALDLSDRYSGQMKHPRIAHAQIRVLHAPDIASLGAPESPPWPAPRSAGTRAALSGSVPPANIAEQVVEQCGFECEPLRGVNDAENPRGLWRSLLGQVRPPSRLAEAELAIGRLAQRTGGVTEPLRDGMSRLELHGVGDSESLDSLIEHIKKSPLSGRRALLRRTGLLAGGLADDSLHDAGPRRRLGSAPRRAARRQPRRPRRRAVRLARPLGHRSATSPARRCGARHPRPSTPSGRGRGPRDPRGQRVQPESRRPRID